MNNDPIFTDYEIRVLKEIVERSDMTFTEPTYAPHIKVWQFFEAPEDLRKLSEHGGDEDWLVLVPASMAEGDIYWIEMCRVNGYLGCSGTSEHILPDGSKVYIGAHA